ncbi:two-component response regulator-like APRR9 isoform X1 [Typha latifolia]|uniref:two-component response regulator-like APRR9 isoform X1 n=1 Tax=Typha latifolia TaxID=4733 RepID=UPI003C2D48EE
MERGGAPSPEVIRWDRFLPRRSLRILLVEHDDSTRHIVTALLRKCSYHVAAVADGLKAWEVLQEKNYGFDLVLSEVAMPSLSGIDLLSKVMAADECKNIPVIMMSSQDSIGVVLKCMLKGAVDFLVKPVRKNELRNLWQHVWRRHSSSSQANASENNVASNRVSVNDDEGSKTRESSDRRGNARRSGSKPDIEVESAQNFKDTVRTEGASSSREVEGKPKGVDDDGKLVRENVPDMDDAEEIGDKSGGLAVEISQQPLFSVHISLENKCLNDNGEDAQCFQRTMDVVTDLNSCCPSDSFKDVVDSVEPIGNRKCSSSILEKDAIQDNALCEASRCCSVKCTSEINSLQLLDLNLRKPQLNGWINSESKEKNILNHSSASAFSRYCDKRIQPSGQELVSSSSCIRRKESVDKERNTSLQPKDILSSHQWNVGEASIYEDVGISCSARVPEDAFVSSSSNRKDIYFHHPQFGLISVPVPVGDIPHQSLGAGYGSILQPMLYSKTSFQSHNSPAVEKTIQIPDQSNSADHNVINQSKCNEFHHHEENHQNPHSKQKVDREPGVSTDISCTPMEQLTRSASCSENVHKDSRSIGSGETAGATRVTGAALENGNESGVQDGNINRSDCGRSRREAALMKFRLKRKDRCFEKKVRYHSRKMLAEQRPRVKGQFVRQKVSESMAPKDVED